MSEEEKIPFGSHLEIDSTNRLDVLRQSKMPEYIFFGRYLRAELQKSLINEKGEIDYPPRPPMDCVEDLFNLAGHAVTDQWQKSAESILENRYQEWIKSIPQTERNKPMVELLSNPAAMEDRLRVKELGALEPLRKINPEAWKSLLIASSERQLASIVLVRYWLKEMSDEEVGKLGMSKPELQLFTDIAGVLGKFVDQAYIKQMEIADQPGGSVETPLVLWAEEDERRNARGADFLYDISTGDNNEPDIKTYNEIFPFEWPKLIKRMRELSKQTKRMVKEGKLPSSYQSLGFVLERMEKVYGSEKTDRKRLDDQWGRLRKTVYRSLEKDCPVSLIPQGTPSVAGDAEKVDVEIRLEIRTPQTKELEKSLHLKQLLELAQKIIDQNQAVLSNKNFKVRTSLTFQPFIFGPNIHWLTTGESQEGLTLTHENSVREVADVFEIPLLEKMFPQEKQDVGLYETAAVLETELHEMGHEVLSIDDDAVAKRIGESGSESTIIEELKAEAIGMHLLDQALGQGIEGIDAKQQLVAKLGTTLNFLVNKSGDAGESGERYYLTGMAVLYRLLHVSGVIGKTEKGYEILDARKGIKALAEMGQELIRLYADGKTTPEKIVEYVEELHKQANDFLVQDFLKILK